MKYNKLTLLNHERAGVVTASLAYCWRTGLTVMVSLGQLDISHGTRLMISSTKGNGWPPNLQEAKTEPIPKRSLTMPVWTDLVGDCTRGDRKSVV